MPKVLTEDAIAQYHREGNFFPIPILCEDEVADLRGRLEAFEAEQGQPIQGATATSRTCCSSGSTT